MVQQVGRAAAALRDRLEEVTADLTARAQAGDPNLKGVTNGQTAKTLAGEVVGREAEKAQRKNLKENNNAATDTTNLGGAKVISSDGKVLPLSVHGARDRSSKLFTEENSFRRIVLSSGDEAGVVRKTPLPKLHLAADKDNPFRFPNERLVNCAKEEALPKNLGAGERLGLNKPVLNDGVIYVNRRDKVRVIYVNRRDKVRFIKHRYYLGQSRSHFARATNFVPPGAKVARKVALYGMPLGITTGRQFQAVTMIATFGLRLALLQKFGMAEALGGRVGIRGSSIHGRKFVKDKGVVGVPFHNRSDLDLFIVSPELLKRWKQIAKKEFRNSVGYTNSTFALKDIHLSRLGLLETIQTLRALTGRRDLTLRIYRRIDGLLGGSRSIDILARRNPRTLPRTSAFYWNSKMDAARIFSNPEKVLELFEYLSRITCRVHQP